MGIEEKNTKILRDAYTAWYRTKGDSSVWVDILADHVDWGSLANGQPGMEFTRPRATKQEVVGYFSELAKDWSMEYYYVDEYVAQGERVVAIGECSWTHKRTGKTATIPKVDIWLFKDGKVIQFMEHYDTHTAIMAATD